MRVVFLLMLFIACSSAKKPGDLDGNDDGSGDGPSGDDGSGNNGDDPSMMMPTNPLNFALAGQVSGLTVVGLVLRNGNDTLSIEGNGAFRFAVRLANAATYNVTIDAQPPGQLCTVTGSAGTVQGADVTSVVVTCVLAYQVGGTVSGLPAGGSVTLQNNAANSATINSNGAFHFSLSVLPGGAYDVTVVSSSEGIACGVLNAKGTVVNAPITTVKVLCLQGVRPSIENGGNWNQYQCSGAEVGHYDKCQHGGEAREVHILGLQQCLLLGRDTLDAFAWECDDNTGHAVYSTKRLKTGKHLRDLVDFNTGVWRDNGFFVQNAAMEQLRTPATKWWTNTIVVNSPDAALGATGAVYLFRNAPGHDLSIASDQVAVAALAGTHEVAVNDRKFVWVDGVYGEVQLINTSFSVIGKLTAALSVNGGIGAVARDVTGIVTLMGPSFFTLRNSTGSSLGMVQAHNAIVQKAVSTSSISVLQTIGAVFQEVYTAGLDVSSSEDNTFLGVTSVGGNVAVAGTGNRLMNVAVVQGAFSTTGSGNVASNTGTPAGTGGVYFSASLQARASDSVLRGAATPPADGNATFAHQWYTTAPSGCAAQHAHSVAVGNRCVTTALVSSMELPDGILNDNDGLCESTEQCVAMLNVGAYQGAGALTTQALGATGPVRPAQYFHYLSTGVTP